MLQKILNVESRSEMNVSVQENGTAKARNGVHQFQGRNGSRASLLALGIEVRSVVSHVDDTRDRVVCADEYQFGIAHSGTMNETALFQFLSEDLRSTPAD